MRPTSLCPIVENMPTDIRQLPQWVCWEYRPRPGSGKKPWPKLPISPTTKAPARTDDPGTWTPFSRAVDVFSGSSLDGIGFVFTDTDPYVGVDLDNCRDPQTGQLDIWASDCIRRLNTYVEVSPSGTGVKCLARGILPSGRRRSGNIEMYDSGRYFALTGHVLNGFDQISDRAVELTELHGSSLGSSYDNAESEPAASANEALPPLPVADEEILHRARRARNGPKFQRLWNGCLNDANGDHSSADMMLCRVLAFWCGPRPKLVDRLFRKSGLYRSKWDEVHYGDGRTYGEATTAKALRDQEHWGFYIWKHANAAPQTFGLAQACRQLPRFQHSSFKSTDTFNLVTSKGGQAMNLLSFLQTAYGSGMSLQTGSEEVTKIEIDDKSENDRCEAFCRIKVVLPSGGDDFQLELLRPPWDARVEGLVEEVEGECESTPLGRLLTVDLSVTQVSVIRRLAKEIRQVVGRGRRYDERNWKWICPRTADSIDQLASVIMDYRRWRKSGHVVVDSVPSTSSHTA